MKISDKVPRKEKRKRICFFQSNSASFLVSVLHTFLFFWRRGFCFKIKKSKKTVSITIHLYTRIKIISFWLIATCSRKYILALVCINLYKKEGKSFFFVFFRNYMYLVELLISSFSFLSGVVLLVFFSFLFSSVFFLLFLVVSFFFFSVFNFFELCISSRPVLFFSFIRRRNRQEETPTYSQTKQQTRRVQTERERDQRRERKKKRHIKGKRQRRGSNHQKIQGKEEKQKS